MPFGWVGSCDAMSAVITAQEKAGVSPMPFGWVGSCDYYTTIAAKYNHPVVSNAFRLGGEL